MSELRQRGRPRAQTPPLLLLMLQFLLTTVHSAAEQDSGKFTPDVLSGHLKSEPFESPQSSRIRPGFGSAPLLVSGPVFRPRPLVGLGVSLGSRPRQTNNRVSGDGAIRRLSPPFEMRGRIRRETEGQKHRVNDGVDIIPVQL